MINKKKPNRCPYCKRKLSDAIAEQVEKQQPCDPKYDCKFKKEIEEAISLSKEPELIEFASDKNEILNNETVNITWKIINAKNCSIEGIGPVENEGIHQIHLRKTTEFILEFEAFNGDLYNSEPIEIKVFPSHEITEFASDKNEILNNELEILQTINSGSTISIEKLIKEYFFEFKIGMKDKDIGILIFKTIEIPHNIIELSNAGFDDSSKPINNEKLKIPVYSLLLDKAIWSKINYYDTLTIKSTTYNIYFKDNYYNEFTLFFRNEPVSPSVDVKNHIIDLLRLLQQNISKL